MATATHNPKDLDKLSHDAPRNAAQQAMDRQVASGDFDHDDDPDEWMKAGWSGHA